jgi:hypothetical protein
MQSEIERVVELSLLEDTLSEQVPRGFDETLRRIREEPDTDMHIQLRAVMKENIFIYAITTFIHVKELLKTT